MEGEVARILTSMGPCSMLRVKKRSLHIWQNVVHGEFRGGIGLDHRVCDQPLAGARCLRRARNRGHLSLASWEVLTKYSEELAQHRLKQHIPQQAWDKLAWHREQGHRLVLVTATVAPMAEAMAKVLEMDAVYGCGPEQPNGSLVRLRARLECPKTERKGTGG